MQAGCSGVTVVGAAAGGTADTTGTILEGATDAITVVTAAGVMMVPVGIASPGTMSTTSYGSAMPHCTAIARR